MSSLSPLGSDGDDTKAYEEILAWPEIETRCAVCLRPFPTKEEMERHDDVECDADPCWCVSLCWVDVGGYCHYPDDLDDDLALFRALRGAQAEVARLRALLDGLGLERRCWDGDPLLVGQGRLSEPAFEGPCSVEGHIHLLIAASLGDNQ